MGTAKLQPNWRCSVTCLRGLVLILLAGLMAPLSAETPPGKPANQEELIQALLTRVGQLEKRVADLESVSPKRYAPTSAVYTVASLGTPAPTGPAESSSKPANMADHPRTPQATPEAAGKPEPLAPDVEAA